MRLSLHDIGKRFNRRWIIRHVDLDLPLGSATAILGANGSGKSTLLRLISGYLHPSEGERQVDGVAQDQMSPDHRRMSFVAPYVDVYREMSMRECIDFHFKFKQRNDLDIDQMMDELGLPMNRELKDFSSGMLQRVKLALAFCSKDPVLLLDEPLMNLDSKGADWYMSILQGQKGARTIVVASNERKEEFAVCDRHFTIEEKRLVEVRG